jgi:hypothetical protein
MSRISSSSFAVNNSLEQKVEVTNASLNVSDSGANLSLGLISSDTASIVTNTANIPANGQNTMTNSLPVVIASDQTEVKNNITQIGGSSFSLGQQSFANSLPVVLPASQTLKNNLVSIGGSNLNLGQTTKSASLPVTLASDQGALTVTLSDSNSGSEGNLDNAQAKVSGDFSSEVDVGSGNNLQISGVTTDTSANPIEIWIAHSSGGTKYKYGFDIYPDSNGYFSEKISHTAINYLSLKYSVAATVTATVLFN